MSIDYPVADEPGDVFTESESEDVLYEDQVQPEYGVLGFTLREIVIVGVWLIAFIVSFFPTSAMGGSVWTSGISWILTIGILTVAVFLLVLRRFSPDGIRRVGSLGIDQFASVAAAVAAIAWAQLLWAQVAASLATGALLVGWVPIVAQIATLALVAATVAAPLIPRLKDDFHGRMETLAHRNANPVRPVITRPRTPRAAAAPVTDVDAADGDTASARDDVSSAPLEETLVEPAGDRALTTVIDDVPQAAPYSTPSAATVPEAADPVELSIADEDAGVLATDPIAALHDIFAANTDAVITVVPGDGGDEVESAEKQRAQLRRSRAEQPQTSAPEPFWILAGSERDVFDEHGQPLYRISPAAWTLVIEDRGGAYVVRHDDGRIGYLHDITDITKG